MREFVEFLVKAMVKNDAAVSVEESTLEDGTINLRLTVDKEDMGSVIGKEGKTIKSVRNLLKAKAIKEDKRVNLELVDQLPL